MNTYLLTLLINSKLEDKERQALLEVVTKQFGKVTKEDLWGVRSLAYPINHIEKAYYVHYEFEAEPQKISSLDKSLKLNEDVIRHLLLRS